MTDEITDPVNIDEFEELGYYEKLDRIGEYMKGKGIDEKTRNTIVLLFGSLSMHFLENQGEMDKRMMGLVIRFLNDRHPEVAEAFMRYMIEIAQNQTDINP